MARASAEGATQRLIGVVATRSGVGAEDVSRWARRSVPAVAEQLERDFAEALSRGRAEARGQASGQVALEMGLIAAMWRGQGMAPPALNPDAEVDTSSDVAWARVGAASMAATWGAAAIAAIGRWRASGGPGAELPKQLQRTTKAVGVAVERHAVTQSAAAYAEQHRALWQANISDVPAVETEAGLPFGWRDVVFDVWSAILDRKTCRDCSALDGQMVPVGRPFRVAGLSHSVPGKGVREAALHPNCRCLIITTVVPEMLRARLPGFQIDYAALKADVSEYFLTAKRIELGQRHAMPFLSGVLGGSTSPETLTRELQRRRYTASGLPGPL